MTKETLTGEIESYQGRNDWPGLTFPIKYSADADVYDNVQELKAAGAYPSDLEILGMVNNKVRTSAKAKAYQAATSKAKEAYENSADYKRKNLVAAALAAGFSQADADNLAKTAGL